MAVNKRWSVRRPRSLEATVAVNPILESLRQTREEMLAESGGTLAGLAARLRSLRPPTPPATSLGEAKMPEISRFFGISIRMYFDDHNPPHFHAIHAGSEIEIGIDPLSVQRGRFPRRALGMVLEWAAIHLDELADNWERLRNDESPRPIAPLD